MRRALLVATATVSLGLLLAAVAHADAAPDIAAPLRAASHAGHVSGNEVTWRSTYTWDHVAPSLDLVRLDFVRPLVAEVDAARSSPGITPLRDATGAIVALHVANDGVSSRRHAIDVTLRAPLAHEDADVLLTAPLARGDAVQRIDVVGDDDRRFEPSASLGLVHNVGFWAAPGVSDGARRDCDEIMGVHEVPIDDAPIYLEGTGALAQHGLRGRILTSADRTWPGRVFALVAFLTVAAALGAVYPWLSRRAHIERAEAALREEYENLGRPSPRHHES